MMVRSQMKKTQVARLIAYVVTGMVNQAASAQNGSPARGE